MTFGIVYAFSENFVLPLSHDEVVHGKASLIGKMPGDRWQKFANLRAYFGFMWTHPGKKLLFMGGEFGQEREWSHDRSLDWHLLHQHEHAGLQRLVRDLNRLYQDEPALHQRDCDPAGFHWIEGGDADQSVFSWERRDARGNPAVVVSNFTPVVRHDYCIGMPRGGVWRERLNTDATGVRRQRHRQWRPRRGDRHAAARAPVLGLPDPAAARDNRVDARRVIAGWSDLHA